MPGDHHCAEWDVGPSNARNRKEKKLNHKKNDDHLQLDCYSPHSI